ncbi:tripartite tricarboxylate transporter substrate-binding protein, partial [Gammaproteobacteria bacterium]|nr:tripartite tricarboxylate transporter substrate-binding protein [Gammaproteobacteria bacterium]
LLAIVLSAAGTVRALEFPPKKITIVMTGSVGGGQDRLTRVFVKVWEKHLGARIGVLPMPGASGRVGLDYFAAQSTDGTVLASVNLSTASIMHRQQKPSWDWLATIHNLGVFGVDPGAIFVRKDSPYQTVENIIDAARQQPMLIGVSQWSNSDNLVIHQIIDQTGAQLQAIPAGGGSATVTAVLGGHVPVAVGKVSNINSVGGELRIIGMTMGENPIPQLTGNAPTINDVLNINSSFSASYRAIVVPASMLIDHPDRYRILKDSFEAAKDDQEYVERAAQNNISSDLILDLDHVALQALVDGYWKAYDESGAFFSVDQKLITVNSELVDVGKDGESVVYLSDGEKKSIRISRTRTRVEITGNTAARSQLKPGMGCEIGWIGLGIGASMIRCH